MHEFDLSSLSSSTVSLANSVSNDANGVISGGSGGKYKTASRSNSRGLYETAGGGVGNNGYSTFPRYKK